MKKGALVSSIAMLLVAVIAMTTASFAWFAASLTPSVGSFDVTVTTQDALVISAEFGANYKTTLPTSDLAAFNVSTTGTTDDATKVNDLLLGTKDVLTASTLGGSSIDIAAANATAYTPMVSIKTGAAAKYQLGFITSPGGTFAAPASADYTQANFDTNISQYLSWDGTAKKYVAATKQDALAAATTDMVINPVTDTTKGVKKHFVAFNLYFRSTLTDSTKTTTICLDSKATKDTDTLVSSFKVLDKNGTELTGSEKQKDLVKSVRVAFVAGVVTDAETGAATKVTVVDPYSTTPGSGDPLFPVDKARNYKTENVNLTATDGATAANTEPVIFASLKTTEVLKVRVYIWIEGNDTDCNNFVLGDNIKLRSNLQFSGSIDVK